MANTPYSILMAYTFTSEKILIDYQPDNWSAKRSDEEAQEIDEVWRSRKIRAFAEGRDLYNSELFRLGSFSATDGALKLGLGNTSYKEYVATRHSDCSMERADPVGTAIIPLSADGYIPLGRRSSKAEVNAGFFFTFGGYFDRQQDFNPITLEPDLFCCAQRETYEEFGLALEDCDLEGIGIVYDEMSCHPEVSFGCRVPLTKSDLSSLDWSSELDDIIFLPVCNLEEFVEANSHVITSTLIGGFVLFRNWLVQQNYVAPSQIRSVVLT